MRCPSKPTTDIGNATANVAATAFLSCATTPLDARMVKTGFDPTTYRLNLHLHFLIFFGRFAHARAPFNQMLHKNAFSLNCMLSGYSKSGNLTAAESLFHAAPRHDAVHMPKKKAANVIIGEASTLGGQQELPPS